MGDDPTPMLGEAATLRALLGKERRANAALRHANALLRRANAALVRAARPVGRGDAPPAGGEG